ncbi:MAG: dicarboxylate/amino acid:cation symporter [Ignavibacteriaceae bacterium]|jgi:Na+/H+-dicarboxylate symporter|nr:dicarboxylate/amino acid:cation symporter [Ignavibacteriaceae bacterium]MCW8811896.1 dicarboxylate/amino acid:cation symporter [Chlorobium sp.]MCW8994282.1 dicarboxylate/amino acid:cation symporter [Psychromonas sp.]MCW8823375.1 dicarboxylate/amino acid:cation symporter [Ignavibacteriaceae bacterium]MCW8960077.1 dicarboxylate/amino acid:cation symporter [Ignavibacteriaceae bacterium]
MLKIKLHWQILIALLIAVLYGLFLTDYAYLVTWIGDLFLRALKMIIVPLILTSIISGVTSIGDAQNLGRLGLKTISYYISTSLFAIVTGLVFVNLIQPGVGADLGLKKNVPELAAASGNVWDIILRMVPTNIFEALVSFDILAIIFFSILFGFFITRLDSKSKDFLTTLFNSGFEVMMKLTHFIIRFTPLGILGIVVGVVADQRGNLVVVLGSLSKYFVTVLIGLTIHATITLPLIIRTVGKINPWKHFQAMTTPLLTAFSTRSSSATLPLTIDAVENNTGVSNKISSFVLPLGATINMDGTALYECVAAMFIAQAYGIELSFLQQMIVVFTALLASIGAAGIPMAGLVMISVILTAVGLPLEGVGLILAVDPFLDMCRTSVNVWSDSCGAATVAKTEGEVLKV